MAPRRIRALLLDRDGTLIEDVPYNGDPALVRPRASVQRGLARARAHGLALAIVSNQSGISRGLLTVAQVDAVNEEVARTLGPFGAILVCPHGEQDGCECRKPRPGMLHAAAARLGVDVRECVMIGDIGADVAAAEAAGAVGVLVPTDVTLADEVDAARLVALDFDAAVTLALGLGSS